MDCETLDVEFAWSSGKLYILQVRPLCLKRNIFDAAIQKGVISRIKARIVRENRPKLFLYGKKTIYGVMPDWNPAEMIGIHPRPLALSLYKEIITDNVWAYQRNNYGYRNLRSFPLLIDFCGLPYIDVRVSFNSFIPADLEPGIAEKLVNYYLDCLERNPSKHDKIEFDIVFSCYTLDLPKRIKVLLEYGFTQDEIEAILDSLKNLTNRIIDSKNGLWRVDAGKMDILAERYKKITMSDLDDVSKAYWLIEDCKRYGTLPFAGLARAAFIAVQFLESMISEGIISRSEYQAFLHDLRTVSSRMTEDLQNLSRQAFLRRYGHLRSGTYDITSPRYDENPDQYFNNEENIRENVVDDRGKEEKFRLSLEQFAALQNALRRHGLSDDALSLFRFMKAAIEGREASKFIFTKNLSETLRLIYAVGKKFGFSREDCAFTDVSIIRDCTSSTMDERLVWAESIARGRKKYREAEGIVLPPLIVKEDDVEDFFMPDEMPTFVTLGKVSGKAVILDTDENPDLHGNIVLISAADPGYDWIFARGIAGFVTEYGGANSHMAIRAGEFSIPAAIGVGRKMFERLRSAKIIEIDAALKKVSILR